MVEILYTSDMHGNEDQYRTFVGHALLIKPEVVIFGGELPPKSGCGGLAEDFIYMQRNFLSNRLPELIRPIKEALPDTQVFVLPGNDDCIVNDDVLDEHPELYSNIDRRRFLIPGGLEIVGYSNVPITPFGIKDREKFDLTEVSEKFAKQYEKLLRTNYNLQGLKSVEKKDHKKSGNLYEWKEFSFSEEDVLDSIQKDLEDQVFITNPGKTIYVFHSPPFDTALDKIFDASHVGSIAEREFTLKYQPFLTLHGHIHECVKMSEIYFGHPIYNEQIGKTWCMSPGNHNEDNQLAVLVIDTEDLAGAKRAKLPCKNSGKSKI